MSECFPERHPARWSDPVNRLKRDVLEGSSRAAIICVLRGETTSTRTGGPVSAGIEPALQSETAGSRKRSMG